MQAQPHTAASMRTAGATDQAVVEDNKPAKPVLSLAVCEDHGSAQQHHQPGEARDNALKNAELLAQRDTLYSQFRPLVQRLIRQYGENVEIRNDLEGEIYYRFSVLLDVYDVNRGVPFKPFIVRQLSAAIYTFARQHWRNQRREVSLELFKSDKGPNQSDDPTSGWDDNLDRESVRDNLPNAIAKLSHRQRKVLIMRYYGGNTFEEIASQMGIQQVSARSHLRHALNHLRVEMAPPG